LAAMTTQDRGEPRAASLPLHERVRLMRDGLLQNVALVVSGVVGIVIVPIVLHGLGEAAYGFWLMAGSLAAVLGCVDLGLGMTTTREVAAARNDETARIVRSAGNLYLALGVAGGVVLFVAGEAMRGQLHLGGDADAHAALVLVLTGANLVTDLLTAF